MLLNENAMTILCETSYACSVSSMAATMSASAMLTSWLVRRWTRSACGTLSAVCTCRASSMRPARTSSTTRVTEPTSRSYS